MTPRSREILRVAGFCTVSLFFSILTAARRPPPALYTLRVEEEVDERVGTIAA